MKPEIKMVAVDVDGTFVRSDYTYNVPRFKHILSRMNEAGCHFVVASGNQYYQLRDLFPGYYDELSFVAENGAFVKDREELVFTANIPKETVDYAIDVCREYPEVLNVLCGVGSAYCERGTVSQQFFDLTAIYYHRLQWVDDFKKVNDQILKFAPTVPEEKTYEYYDMFRERLKGKLEPTTSGHGSIDLIVPGCHKASGLKRLVERWGITPEQCAAFGDGGNDIEMLRYCAHSYAVDNAPQNVKDAAKYVCPSNEEDGVLVTLEKLFYRGDIMKITEVKSRTPDLIEQLLKVWEGSVRATHLFLSDDEIKSIKEYVPQALNGIAHLMIAEDDSGRPAAFMGIEDGSLEMLFVAPEERGKGLGKRLIQYGIENYAVERLAVNEQNPQAKGFYEHMGFQVYKRTDLDEQGNPYPLLYMRRPADR